MRTDQYMTRAREALGDDIRFVPVGAWWDAPGFLEIIAQRVDDALALRVPVERRDTTEVIFSAHSLPGREDSDLGRYLPRAVARKRRARRRPGGR